MEEESEVDVGHNDWTTLNSDVFISLFLFITIITFLDNC